jgi:hypothetical protein
MKIENKMGISPPRETQAGDILVGDITGAYYIVLADTSRVLNLTHLCEGSWTPATHLPTGITKENITITFEGVK